MIVHPLHLSYAVGEVVEGFDKRGNVTASRIEFLLGLIARLTRDVGPGDIIRVLDLGCGTGRFSIPVAMARPNFKVTGADKSEQMLERARGKPHQERVDWVVEDAHRMRFSDNAFHIVFMSDVLHHFAGPQAAMHECFRVLEPGGWVISKYGAMEHIMSDPEHIFFPSALEVDLARTPSTEDVERNMRCAGFRDIQSEARLERTRLSGQERLEAAKAKSISVLHLLSEADYQTGLARLNDYIEKNPNNAWLQMDAITYTCGLKK